MKFVKPHRPERVAVHPAKSTRREPRIRAILAAAEDVFLEHGYLAGSLDEVARRANASKATIYAHFGSKEGLFKVIVAQKLASATEVLRQGDERHAKVAETLSLLGKNFLKLLLSPGPLKIYRLMVAQGEQFPELAQLWFENGPKAAIATLGRFLNEHQACGELELDDPEQAAEFFLMMLRGRLHIRAVSGLSKPPYEKEIDRTVAAAVDMFMRAYGGVQMQGRKRR